MIGDLLTFADWRQFVLDWCAFWPLWAFQLVFSLVMLDDRDWAHHGYYGLALVVPPWFPWWVRGIGLVFLIDDSIQHTIQCWGPPTYRSPINRLYQWAFGPLHRKVVAWWLTR